MAELLPISAIVPTRHRPDAFANTLRSLAQQLVQPVEMIVVDGSEDDQTKALCHQQIPALGTEIKYYHATEIGAAVQRNQAFKQTTQDFIWLMDDDVLLEPDCLRRLWTAINSDAQMGGVNAMIMNQRYLPPGRVSRTLFQLLHGKAENTYEGKCIGPAFNLLPEDRDELPEVVPVEWLNTTCTLYRRDALPQPLFPSNFVGYSLMEDVTLSLIVGRQWKLSNARTARIFHDSQPGDHKSNPRTLARMGLVNRHFVMTQILHRRSYQDYWKLFILQIFETATLLQTLKGWMSLLPVIKGKLDALIQILRSSGNVERTDIKNVWF